MKKLYKKTLRIFCLLFMMCLPFLDCSLSEDALAESSMNVFVYIIGSDLEEEAGAATQDIKEMLRADIPRGTKIYLCMGGAKHWFLDDQYNDSVTYAEVTDGDIVEIEKVPDSRCGTTESLFSFLDACMKRSPSENNALILWGHGCSGIQGIGYDSIFGNDTLTLNEIAEALEQIGIQWDFIGFDACNMSTIETIWMLQDHAKYILASPSNESVQGWPYHTLLPITQELTEDMPIKIKQAIENSYRRLGYDIEMSVINCEAFAGLNEAIKRLFAKAPSMQMGIDILSICEEVEDEDSIERIRDVTGKQCINTGIYLNQEEYEQLLCSGMMPQYCKWILRCNGWKE